MLADAPYHKPTDAEMEQYMSLMNVTGTGIMGSISIPKINVQLPIYHDVTESVLQVAVGHMPGTSLPVVSESSHVVISGHNGLITSAMFAELPRLQEGDTFQITALRQVLTYEVDQILTVRPDEVEAVAIMPGKEYCTLITCTPPGLNTYRLLVRGHRIDAETLDAAVAAPTFAGFMQDVLKGKVLSLYEVMMLCIALILLVAEFAVPLGLAIYRRNHKKYKQRTQRWTRDNT